MNKLNMIEIEGILHNENRDCLSLNYELETFQIKLKSHPPRSDVYQLRFETEKGTTFKEK